MVDLSNFDQNGVANPNANIFGLPFSEEDAGLIIFPVPWEVTVSYGAGTGRCFDSVFAASFQVDLFNKYYKDTWKNGFFMADVDKKILMKSDYLRKEAELYVDFIGSGEDISTNNFMARSLKDINEGGIMLNEWVYEHTRHYLNKNKLVGLLGGDHSTPLGYIKALSERHESFGILQIDAHCDLRKAYEDFVYSHASIMYNVLNEIPQVKHITQIGVRDYCKEEWDFVQENSDKVTVFFDSDIKSRMYEGEIWKVIVDEVIATLPEKIYISFDIDGLDPKLCPNTGTPVQGGFESEQVVYLLHKVVESGRKIIGYDLVETGTGEANTDANVGARFLWHLSNILTMSNI